MVKVEGTLEELEELFGSLKRTAKGIRKTAKVAKKTGKSVRTKLSEWQRFLKSFKFRKQKRNESPSTYFGLRTKAASRAYKKMKRKK